MNIGIIGAGYVGLVTGACLVNLGHTVYCVDIDKEKVEKLKEGVIPIYEPGLSEMIVKGINDKRIFFSTEIKDAVKPSKAIFIAVGTPSKEDGSMDLSYVEAAAKEIGKHIDSYKIIINKSTVPPGTGNFVRNLIKKGCSQEFDVISNPEFLKEGSAIKDFMSPDRIVIGIDNGNKESEQILQEIYRPLVRIGKPLIITSVETAEMIKYTANAMLATKISFMNQLTGFCEAVGADIKEVARGIGLDDRIGPRFLQAGIGYGGSCFPKDVRGLIKAAEKHGFDLKILKEVDNANENQKKYLIPKIKEQLGDLNGKNIAIWGLSFKPKTDDMRDAPSIANINELQKLGAKIKVYDPEAMENAKKILKGVEFHETPLSAIKGCYGLIIATEWDEFRAIDKSEIKRLLKEPNVFDGRNIYEPDEMKEYGFNYHCVGRITK